MGSSLGHKNDMFCLPGVVFFFLAKFPLSADLIYEWAQMHLIILRGRNPPALYESISSYARSHLPLIQEEQVVSYWRKNMHFNWVNCPRRASAFVALNAPKPFGQPKPNFTWSLLGSGERKFVRGIWVT